MDRPPFVVLFVETTSCEYGFLTCPLDLALLTRKSNFTLELKVVTDLSFVGVVDSRNGQKIHFIEKIVLPYSR